MQDVIDFDILKEYDTALKEVLGVWTKQKAYSLGDKVKYKGHLLECTTAGTTGTTTLNFTGLDIGDTITDGTVVWTRIENVFTGATSLANGTSGSVPQPTTSDITKFLCGDGTWKSVGGNGLNVIDDTLWSGTFNSVVAGDTLTLQNNYADYDEIFIYIGGQYCRSLITSLGVAMGYDNDGGNLGATYLCYVIITFSGNSGNALIWQYGTNMASTEVRLVGRKYINPNNYSTTEQEIGTWIDGKPLYQKTFTGTTGSGNSGDSINCTALGIDKCVDISGCIQNINDGFIPVNYNNNNNYTTTGFGADKILYFNVNGSIFSNCPYSITIKYTKV